MRPRFSAILPTTQRRRTFLPLAFDSLVRQNADDVELIVVTEDTIAFEQAQREFTRTGLPGSAHLTPNGISLGVKRNMACELAQGEWITFWDDDDWSRSDRLDQTRTLCSPDVVLVGSQTMLVHELVDERRRTVAYRYRQPPNDVSYPPKFFVGGLLTFRQELWQRQPFGDDRMGEEAWWQIRLGTFPAAELTDDPTLYVSMLHGHNTAYQRASLPSGDPTHSPWKDLNSLGELMGIECLQRYEFAAAVSNKNM